MASYLVYLARFNDAVKAGETEDAIRAASGMADWPGVTIGQDRDLLVLMARDDDPRLGYAIQSFFERYIAEGHTPNETQIMMAAVGGLRDSRSSHRCKKVLEALMNETTERPRHTQR